MRKAIWVIALMAVLIISLAAIGYAITCDFDQTATTAGTSNTYIRGSTQNLSVTLSGWTDDANSSVAIISAGATGCTITGALTFNTSTNTNQSYMNTTVNTLAMEDDTTCTFTMTIKNASNQVSLTTCAENYISDNTVPTCVHSQSSKTTYKPEKTWTVTGANANLATLQFGSNPSSTMTESSDTFTYTTKEGTLTEGTYSSVTATTSDGLNSTSCRLEYVQISSEDKLVQVAVASSGQKGEQVIVSNAGNTNNKTLMVVLMIGIAVYLYINKKK